MSEKGKHLSIAEFNIFTNHYKYNFGEYFQDFLE